MVEPRGSSANTALPPIHDPDIGSGPLSPDFDEAPTQIKPPGSSDPKPIPVSDNFNAFGVTLGHFELLDCIGVGGMGRVFRARDTNLDRMVAVKVLAPDVGKDPEVCRRFEQEGKAAARLDDRHFARVYYCGQDKGLQYIAMEYVEGENLRTMIERHGRLDFELVVNIGIQIARGLAHAARCGVVHRDIKPSNIILNPSGTAKLVDMGLARNFLQQSSPASEITQAGATLGTFDYISPEQARDARDADVRSDIYSLGCTLYHALAGRPPYPEGSALQKLLQHQNDAVPDVRRSAPDLPELVAAIVHKMMAKNPNDRYQTPTELIADLMAVSAELGIPLPEEADFVADLGTGQTFWERQLVWFVPTILFCCVVWLYSFLENEQELDLPAWQSTVAKARGDTPADLPDDTPTATPAERAVQPVRPIRLQPGPIAPGDLTRVFVDATPGQTIRLSAGVHELPSTDSMQIVIDKQLTIAGPNDDLATIVLNDSGRGDGIPFSMFQIDGPGVRFSRIRFQMTCDTGRGAILAIAGGQVELNNCVFDFRGNTSLPTAMIEVKGSSTATVIANSCYFTGIGDGIHAEGTSKWFQLSNCGFDGPLYPFAVKGQGDCSFNLQHVTTKLDGSSLIRTDSVEQSVSFIAYECVFSQTGANMQPLISDGQAEFFEGWRGADNLFYGFDHSMIDTGQQIQPGPMERPFAEVKDTQSNPCLVFRLASPTRHVARTGLPIGFTTGPWGSIYEPSDLERAKEFSSQAATTDTAAGASANGTHPFSLIEDGTVKQRFSNLLAACLEANGDDPIIEVAKDEPIAVEQVTLDKSLTIRAAEGSSPVFVWNAESQDPRGVALFRLTGKSELKIEGIHFKAAPRSRIPPGSCLFECQFGSTIDVSRSTIDVTPLEVSSGELPIFLIKSDGSVDSRSQMPKMADAPAMTSINVQRASIRTAYSLLDAEPLALWSLGLSNSFFASSNGSLIYVHGPSVMLADAFPNANLLDIQQSTCATKDSLVVVSVDGTEPPRQMEVLISDSALIGRGMALVRSSGNFELARHDNSFKWQIPKDTTNFVVGYRRPHQPSGNTMPMSNLSYASSDWRDPQFEDFIYSDRDVSEFWNEQVSTMPIPDENTLTKLGYERSPATLAPGVIAQLLPSSAPQKKKTQKQ